MSSSVAGWLSAPLLGDSIFAYLQRIMKAQRRSVKPLFSFTWSKTTGFSRFALAVLVNDLVSSLLAPAHVHILGSSPPSLSVSKLVPYVKGRSSHKLQREFPCLRKRYWGQHLWARGSFCATVGSVAEASIKLSIASQRWEADGGQGFKVEPPPLP